jgi:hypothetical protein
VTSRFRLYTVGYRDAEVGKRRIPEEFFGSLPGEALTVDLRSHAYSPFAPEYTGKGVAESVERWKPGIKEVVHLKALGNTRRESTGKRISPPVYVDAESGFPRLESLIREHQAVVIFCACSLLTQESSRYRCHRFFVAEEMLSRLPEMEVLHLP